MPNGVDASIDAVQSSAADAVLDRIVGKPAFAELRPRDHAPDGAPRHECVGFLG